MSAMRVDFLGKRRQDASAPQRPKSSLVCWIRQQIRVKYLAPFKGGGLILTEIESWCDPLPSLHQPQSETGAKGVNWDLSLEPLRMLEKTNTPIAETWSWPDIEIWVVQVPNLLVYEINKHNNKSQTFISTVGEKTTTTKPEKNYFSKKRM